MSQVDLRDRLDPVLENWLRVRGFDPNNLEQPGENGDTALMQATREEELEIARSLIRAGASLNARNNDGNNVLWFACFRDRYDPIALLVDAGIDCDNLFYDRSHRCNNTNSRNNDYKWQDSNLSLAVVSQLRIANWYNLIVQCAINARNKTSNN